MKLLPLSTWTEWAVAYDSEEDRLRRKVLLRARTAIGFDLYPDEHLVRLMVFVAGRMDTTLNLMEEKDPITLLQRGYGWCCQQCSAFGFLATHILNVDVELLAIAHSDGTSGHTVVQVHDANSTMLFDVASEHCAVYAPEGCVLGYKEICSRPQVLQQEGHWWKGANGQGKEGFYSPEAKVEVYRDLPEWKWPWSTHP